MDIVRTNVNHGYPNIKGEKYDCHDNGRARDAGNDQKGIDDVLAKTDPFGDGRQVRVEKIGVKRDIVRSRTSDSDDI